MAMKQRYWLFRRGSTFYLQDAQTGKKESLRTRDPRQAERLRAARNETAEKPLLGLTLGKAYLSWEIGAAQTDTALLTAEDIDRSRHALAFRRCKTGEWAHLMIGPRLQELLEQLPAQGPLFPTISRSNASARSAEFCRRCRLLAIKGVSLHSYRYAWAERAKASGYPERWAQNALGHKSRAVHEAYARGAVAVCPSLENYEKTTIPFPQPAIVPELPAGGTTAV